MAAAQSKQVSEEWFERYLRDHGLAGWEEHHPDLSDKRRPDYRVARGAQAAICEVKEFRTTRLRDRFRPGHAFVVSDAEEFGSVRNAVSNAAKKQLKPFRKCNEPLVVVLVNPHLADVSLEEPDEVLFALYGSPQVLLPVQTSGPSSAGQSVYGRGGVLRNKHQYVSAVVTLHLRTNEADYWDNWLDAHRAEWEDIDDTTEQVLKLIELRETELARGRIPTGDYLYVRVFSTKASAEGHAVAISQDLFAGPRDEFWAYEPASGMFVRVR